MSSQALCNAKASVKQSRQGAKFLFTVPYVHACIIHTRNKHILIIFQLFTEICSDMQSTSYILISAHLSCWVQVACVEAMEYVIWGVLHRR